jgi:2-C-methyl-D-erythritol 4-phosphate cytidylyltransferase
VTGIIVAAGSGERMGVATPKQFLLIREKPVLAHTIERLQECDEIDDLVVVVPKGKVAFCMNEIVKRWRLDKVTDCVEGGEKRQDSVYRGLAASKGGLVCVHDGVRPVITPRLLSDCIGSARTYGAAVTAVPVRDTVKKVHNNTVLVTLDRSELWEVQTPQAFDRELLVRAFESAMKESFYGTDESSLVERIGASVHVVIGSRDNIKITALEDMEMVEALLEKRSGCAWA